MYETALRQLVKQSDEKFPGPYGGWKRLSLNMKIYPRNDARFGVDGTRLFERFFSASFRAGYEKAVGADAAQHEAFLREQQKEYERAQAGGHSDAIANANAVAIGKIFSGNDPGTVTARRCIELGRSQLECTGKGAISGLLGLVGLGSALQPGAPKGLRMTGIYTGGGPKLEFHEGTVALAQCGKLVSQDLGYAVTKAGSALQIEIASSPRPFSLSLGPDGRLAGPGATTVDGRIITGYEDVFVAATGPDGITPENQHWEKRPILASATERCVFASLQAAGPSMSFDSALANTMGILSGKGTDRAARDAQKVGIPPGVRLSGLFAGPGGLKVEFHTEGAVLDCGEAHVARPYQINATPDATVVTINNGGAPIALHAQADGSLLGSGAVDIEGRVMTGMSANGPVFAPKRARCAVGRLAPN
jgi:hypothetical protein